MFFLKAGWKSDGCRFRCFTGVVPRFFTGRHKYTTKYKYSNSIHLWWETPEDTRTEIMQWADQRCICPVVRLRMVEGGYKLSSIAEKDFRFVFLHLRGCGWLIYIILNCWESFKDTNLQFGQNVFLHFAWLGVDKGGYLLVVSGCAFFVCIFVSLLLRGWEGRREDTN